MSKKITDPGFYSMTAKEYHADPVEVPSLSSSVAVELLTKSPEHVHLSHPRLSYKPSAKTATDAMGFGTVVHELLLGKGSGFAIWEGKDWRGKEAGEFWDAAIAEGKTPIKNADYGRAAKCALTVNAKLESYGLGYVLTEGVSEEVAVWKEGSQYCRAMFDRHIPHRHEIWDIKTTGKGAHPDQLSRTIASMNYDMRSEFYLMGAEKLTGIPSIKGGYGFCFLFVETEEPFDAVPCYLDASFKTRGRMRAKQAIDTWVRCMESHEWPSYVTGPVEIAAPGWVDFEIEEQGITTSGERIL